jgi:hypothetical protein
MKTQDDENNSYGTQEDFKEEAKFSVGTKIIYFLGTIGFCGWVWFVIWHLVH